MRHELFQMCKKILIFQAPKSKTNGETGQVGGGHWQIKSVSSGMAPFFYLKTLGDHLRRGAR